MALERRGQRPGAALGGDGRQRGDEGSRCITPEEAIDLGDSPGPVEPGVDQRACSEDERAPGVSHGPSGLKAARKQGGIEPDNRDIWSVDGRSGAQLGVGRIPGIVDGDAVGAAKLNCASEAQQPKGEFRAPLGRAS
jgi:hypothetical protein